MKKFLIWTAVFVVLIIGIFIYINIFFTYSDGDRAGRLIKFSHKGYLFKTYEGELNLGGINSVNGGVLINNIWYFSVTDKTVADSLSMLEGRDINLHYREKISALFWRGDTRYIVDRVVQVK